MTVGFDINLPFADETVGHSLRSALRDRARGLPWLDARGCVLPTEAPIVRVRPVQVTRDFAGRDARGRSASSAPALSQPLEEQWSFFVSSSGPSPTRATRSCPRSPRSSLR